MHSLAQNRESNGVRPVSGMEPFSIVPALSPWDYAVGTRPDSIPSGPSEEWRGSGTDGSRSDMDGEAGMDASHNGESGSAYREPLESSYGVAPRESKDAPYYTQHTEQEPQATQATQTEPEPEPRPRPQVPKQAPSKSMGADSGKGGHRETAIASAVFGFIAILSALVPGAGIVPVAAFSVLAMLLGLLSRMHGKDSAANAGMAMAVSSVIACVLVTTASAPIIEKAAAQSDQMLAQARKQRNLSHMNANGTGSDDELCPYWEDYQYTGDWSQDGSDQSSQSQRYAIEGAPVTVYVPDSPKNQSQPVSPEQQDEGNDQSSAESVHLQGEEDIPIAEPDGSADEIGEYAVDNWVNSCAHIGSYTLALGRSPSEYSDWIYGDKASEMSNGQCTVDAGDAVVTIFASMEDYYGEQRETISAFRIASAVPGKVFLPCGISIGTSTIDDVINAYGSTDMDPQFGGRPLEYEEGGGVGCTYANDNVEMSLHFDDGVLTSVIYIMKTHLSDEVCGILSF